MLSNLWQKKKRREDYFMRIEKQRKKNLSKNKNEGVF